MSTTTGRAARGIVRRQVVNREKLARAKELRGNMTEAEARLWQLLRGDGLAGLHFRRQQVIDGFIVDFYCNAASLIVEVDGDVHEQQREYDAERDAILLERGIRTLRVTNTQVLTALTAVLQRIQAAAMASKPRVPKPNRSGRA